MKRSTASESLSATRCSTLTAARRFSSGCSASYTAPKPPSPNLRSSRYSPAMRPPLSLERWARFEGEPAIVVARDDNTPLCDDTSLWLTIQLTSRLPARQARLTGEADVDSDRGRGWLAILGEPWA